MGRELGRRGNDRVLFASLLLGFVLGFKIVKRVDLETFQMETCRRECSFLRSGEITFNGGEKVVILLSLCSMFESKSF